MNIYLNNSYIIISNCKYFILKALKILFIGDIDIYNYSVTININTNIKNNSL